MKLLFRLAVVALSSGFLVACDDGTNYAPVTEVSMIEPIPSSGTHRVTSGETLYEIAWRYGMDYRTLAHNNHIQPPYTVKVGQVVYLRGRVGGGEKQQRQLIEGSCHPRAGGDPSICDSYNNDVKVTSRWIPAYAGKTDLSAMPATIPVTTRNGRGEPSFSTSTWRWPATGKVIRGFSGMNKGLNIAGNVGDPVYAAAPGKVVYCGDGLRGYGNLIIIKHNSSYLSAYAHNSVLFVKEGAWVKQGQIIAEIGKSGTTKSMLHFEIRRAGKPIDPMPLLKA